MPSLTEGRVNQKLRTRNALLAAAQKMMRDGAVLNVAEVADLAQVSRTTAYRYFPTAEGLLANVALHAIADIERRSIDAALDQYSDPSERLRAVVDAADRSVAEHENLFRAVLRQSLAGDEADPNVLPRRAGVRRALIESAIEPLRRRLGKKPYDRLVSALSLCIGIEGDIVLQDVCQLSPDLAREFKVWAAGALLNQALREAPDAGKPPARRPAKAP